MVLNAFGAKSSNLPCPQQDYNPFCLHAMSRHWNSISMASVPALHTTHIHFINKTGVILRNNHGQKKKQLKQWAFVSLTN